MEKYVLLAVTVEITENMLERTHGPIVEYVVDKIWIQLSLSFPNNYERGQLKIRH